MTLSRYLLLALPLALLPLSAGHAVGNLGDTAPQTTKPARGSVAAKALARPFKGGPRLELAVPDRAKLQAEDLLRDDKPGTPLRYGQVQQVALDATADGVGVWSETADGRLSWRFEVSGKGASSLEVAFSRFHLPHGATLTIRSADGAQVLDPLTDADNPASGVLHTAMLNAEVVVLELELPADKREFLQLELASATYGYRDPFSAARAKSGSCNIDVACPEGDDWRDQVASVAHYSFSSGGGSYVCTGSLMNTGHTTQDLGKPRFSTAYHCVSTQSEAGSMVFYWGYESPICRTPGGAASGVSLPRNANSRAIQSGGATLVATNRATDFTALELNSAIPATAQVHYSGWDRSGSTPSAAVGIHHPDGHEKRISFDDNPLTTMQNCIIPGSTGATHWRVGNWERGTTEGGSSGSGLWSANNGLLVGVLSGGTAGCGAPTGFDCYGRLSEAWEATSSTGSTIRAAFDRSGTNPQTMPGKGTCNAPVVTLTSSAFSSAPRAGESFQLSASASGGAGGYIYHWDLDGDGVFERDGTRQVTASFPARRSGNMQLRVVDSAGCATTVSRALDIAAPVIEVASVGSPAQVCGNSNGGIDKGERFSLPVTLRNSGNVALPAGARALFAPAAGMDVDAGPNSAGYVGVDSCAYGYVDISRGANAVDALETYVGNGNAYGPLDDARSTEIVLGGSGIELYGTRHTRAVMSTNGYVSFDPAESGGDWSVSCDGELDQGAKGPQLRPYHDDMVVRDEALAGLRYRRFATCPRVADSGEAQPCHVFQWNRMGYYVSGTEIEGDFEFQAIAYETTGEIAYQYFTAAPDQGAWAHIGIIDAAGSDPLSVSCVSNAPTTPAQSAICVYPSQVVDAIASPAFRLEAPTVQLPAIAPGASTTVNLPLAIRSDTACGTPLKLDYIATAASGSHSVQSSSHAIGSVRDNCQTVSSCPAQITQIDIRDGNYYNPQRSGNGFNNYPIGGVWYTANADHTPAWYNIVGEYQDNLLRTPILHVTNQATLPTISTQIRNAGSAHVARIDATNLMFAWRMDNGSSGAELLRLTSDGVARAGNDHTQHWYPPSQSGWGLNVESLRLGGADKDLMLIYLYDAAGNPRWVTGEGPLDSHRPHCPGCPYYPDWNARKQPAGNAVLNWDGAAKGRINTTITLPSPLQGTWNRSNVPVIPIGEVRP